MIEDFIPSVVCVCGEEVIEAEMPSGTVRYLSREMQQVWMFEEYTPTSLYPNRTVIAVRNDYGYKLHVCRVLNPLREESPFV